VLEPVGDVGVALEGADLGHGGPCLDRHDQPEQDTGDGGVHPRGVDQRPRGEGQRNEQPPVGDPPLHEHRECSQRQHSPEQGRDLEVGGVEDRDDRDGDEVVDDREGEQERAQG
jgi:hypothetical protein